ncbi:putative uncharacterized protein [Clostridium sp. CAG:571]|nr:putative uncharacterized protein [Clostridium sp. CAG:571]
MKKVLILGYSSMIGGVETYIANLLKYIDKKKFTVDLLVQDDITGINAERIKNNYNKIFIVENLKRHPFKAYRTLVKIYKENNYDVIYMCLSTASSFLYALPAKKYIQDVKIVVHSHNGSDKKIFQHLLFRGTLNKMADKKLACSKLAAEWMYGKKELKKDKVVLINNAIESDMFLFNKNIRKKIREDLKLNDNQFLIGHVGRFNEQKNHTELLDIFFELLKKDKSFKLLLIGDGELKNQIISKSKEIGIFDKIIFLEAKKNIYDYYQAMDLFIMPSIFEGLPIVGIEAQTSGLKCIFSKNITEESNITGNVSFVELENHNEWCNQIIEKRNNYTISGRTDNKIIKSLIESGYDLKNETKKIENIFDSLIN